MADRLQAVFDLAAREKRATYDIAREQLEACLMGDRDASQANANSLAVA